MPMTHAQGQEGAAAAARAAASATHGSAAVGAFCVLPARVGHEVAPALLAQCSSALASGAPGVDLAACQDFDSSLIAILLELLRQAAARGTPIHFRMPPANLRKLAALYGVDSLLFPAQEPA